MSSNESKVYRVGSRRSELALIQTKHVIRALEGMYSDKKFEIVTMTTLGDRILNISLPKIGEKSLFTRDLEDALIRGDVDFVVHSLKDLPTALPDKMVIGAILEREDPRDALVLNDKFKDKTLETLPIGSIIGTSSLRRTAQLARKYSHLKVQDIRGNLNTRLAKLDATDSKFAGIILAYAGLCRMGWQHRISQILDSTDILYAVGQGALAVECCIENKEVLEMLQHLTCQQTQCQILIERSFLKTLGGGCSAPVAINTNLKLKNENDKHNFALKVTGAVWSLDGKTELHETIYGGLNIKIKKNNNRKRDYDNVDDVVDDEVDEKINNNNKKTKFNKLSIVDESFASTSDMQKLISIHEHIFKTQNSEDDIRKASSSTNVDVDNNSNVINEQNIKMCPYLHLNAVNPNESDNNENSGKCPVKHLSIGNDVMAQCPVISAGEQDIKIYSKTTNDKCPLRNYPIGNDVMAQCPFKNIADQQIVQKEIIDNNLNVTTTGGGGSSQINDTNNNNNIIVQEKEDIDKKSTDLVENNCTLYCGLYRHDCIDKNLLEKCENLGRNLAHNLINNGALDIMKCAQLEIRKK